jgi:hypothetical protein
MFLLLYSAIGANRALADDAINLSVSAAGDATISGTNTNNAADSDGVRGIATGTGRNAGVRGNSQSTASDAAGVLGREGTQLPVDRLGFLQAGVRGESKDKRGMLGVSEWRAVAGWATGTGQVVGVEGVAYTGTDTDSVGVLGQALNNGKRNFGVRGSTPSVSQSSAGVLGEAGATVNIANPGQDVGWAGVRGMGRFTGVAGHSYTMGISGKIYDPTTGALTVEGNLARKFVANTYGVWTSGDLAARGVKKFIEPHPFDPTKIIGYVALEGPEAGTYFRGTSKTVGGVAVISVPDHFRYVTAEGSITVQVTPRDLAVVAVVDRNLDQITVRSDHDVDFDYLVQGVRRAFADYVPIQNNGGEFGGDATLDGSLPQELRDRLITNGTYHLDGTPNLELARKLGWLDREQQANETLPINSLKDSRR